MNIKLLKQLITVIPAYLILTQNIHSQSDTYFLWDSNRFSENFYIDTTLSDNIWQFGSTSSKASFNHLIPPWKYCLMTDTLSSYPANNHSAFILKYEIGESDQTTLLRFDHFYNTDNSYDGGYIEVSYDEGSHWTNIVYDAIYPHDGIGNFYTISDTLFNGEPGFSGNSENDAWQKSSYGWWWYEIPKPEQGIYIRFNFISDSVENLKPGWIVRLIWMYGGGEGINNQDIGKIHLYPNPTQNLIFFQNGNFHNYLFVEVLDVYGRRVMFEKYNPYLPNSLDVSSLSEGIYLLQIKTKKSIYSSKFMKY